LCCFGTIGREWTSITGVIRHWNSASGHTQVDVFDVNGDGLLDRIDTGDGTAWSAAVNAGTTRPNLLTTMSNGIGGTTSFEYGPSTDSLDGNTGGDGVPDLPFITWVVSSIQHWTTGVGATDLTTRYLYKGGRFHRGTPTSPHAPFKEREFRGFREVWAVEEYGPDDIRAVATTFGQTDQLKGRVLRVDTYAGRAWLEEPHQLVRAEYHTWSHRPQGGRIQPWLSFSSTLAYDDQPYIQAITMTAFEPPDEFGNVVQTRNGYATPWVETRSDYAQPDPGSEVRDKPKHTWSVDNDGRRFAEKWFYYDDLPYGRVSKGNATKIETALVDGGSSTVTTVLMAYDAFGNVTRVTDPLGYVTKVTYDAKSLYETRTDRQKTAGDPNDSSNFLFTARTTDLKWGLPTHVQDEAGRSTRYKYDSVGRLELLATPGHALTESGCTSRYSYFYGNAVDWSWVREERKEPGSGYRPTIRFFDGLGRYRKSVVERVVDGTLSSFDAERVTYDAAGRVDNRFDAYGGKTMHSYRLNGGAWIDPLARVHRVTPPDSTSRRTEYAGYVTTSFDEAGQKASVMVDTLGRVIEETVFQGTAVYSRKRYTHDGAGRVLTVTQNDDALTKITTTYDSLGRKVSMSDPDSGTWTYRYDSAGNLFYQDDPKLGQHIQLCWDGLGRITKKYYLTQDTPQPVDCATMTDCHAGNESLVCHEYDAAGSRGLPRRVFDRSGETLFTHDSRGRLQRVIKAIVVAGVSRQASVDFAYDDVNRLATVIYPDGEQVTTQYDASGQPVALTSNDSVAGAYVDMVHYDRLGRAKRVEHHNGVIDTHEFYGPGRNHRLKRLKSVRGTGTNLDLEYAEYWSRGMLRKVIDHRDAGGALSNTADFTYDHMRRLTQVDRPGGQEQYGFDTYGNLRQKEGRLIHYNDPARPHQPTSTESDGTTAGLFHDSNGNREGFGGALYDYDEDDRLREVAAGASPVWFVYDYAGERVASAVGQGLNVRRYYGRYFETTNDGYMTKHYFLGGRRIASRRVAAPAGTAAIGDRAVQLARLPGQLAVVLVLRRDAQVGAGLAMVVVAGGLLAAPWRRRRACGLVLRHGHVVLAAAVFAAGTMPLPFALLPLEGKAWANGGGGSGGGGGVPTPTPGVPPPSFVHYHTDHLGSTQVVTDGATGEIGQQLRYTSWGELRARLGANGQPTQHSYRFQFTGYEEEESSGLYHAGARFYDPGLGLFLTHDPLRQFSNPYSYGYGDPVNGTDPTGALWNLVPLLIVAFVAGFAVSAYDADRNGASAGGIVKAGLIGGATSAVGALVLGPVIGYAASTFTGPGTQVALGLALVGSGAYSTYSAVSSNSTQVLGTILGAITTALGAYSLARGFSQGGNSLQRAGNGDANEWGDLYDLAFAEKTTVEPGTTEYETLTRAANTLRHDSTRAGVQTRLDDGGFVVFEQAKGNAPAFTFRETTYVARTSLDLQPRHLGVHLAHEQFHILDRAILPQNAWFERRADGFSLQAFDSGSNVVYPTSQDLYRGALERYPWPWSR
jgi:RHS repeat-associated protein